MTYAPLTSDGPMDSRGGLVVSRLNAYYDSAHVLFDVDLSVSEGMSLVLLGRNGAGKSTLLNAIMRSSVRTQGSVTFGQERIDGMPTHRIARLGLQLVPEDRRVYPNFSVQENLRLARAAAGGRDPRPLQEILELFPTLRPLLARRGNELSGGEQQLVAIARAMVASPRLLLLDEPSAGLSPVIMETVGEAVAAIRKDGRCTLVIAEQNARFGIGLADEVAVIDEGRIVFRGTRSEFEVAGEVALRYLSV